MKSRDLPLGAVVLVVLCLLPLAIRQPFDQNILILAVMYTALAQAWNLLGGYCGQVSLGQALFFGIGAYASTILFTRYGVSPLLGMLVGGALAALVALAIGWPCFRLRGHYFVIATIVVAETGYLLFLNWDWAGAATGILIPIAKDSFVNFQFQTSKLPYYYGILVIAAVLWLFCYWIERSKWGFYWRAVKSSPEAAESLGVRIFRYKMAAAAASAFFTGICGSFYAQYVSYIDPDSVMALSVSILISLPAVLGGIGTLWGPAVGAAVLIPMSELVRAYLGGTGQGTDLIIYGVLIMGVAALEPEGLCGLFAKLRRRLFRARAVARRA
ncbi:MAG TPA: branched-chain amino acid ABC transporter permease [Alphaproteobacteria bacterium]|nr:branched-chain amino acid ABC transporter permease [Alphaproteobacteria bacterium]